MSKLVGFRHFNGTSKKTGNQYDFFQCHFLKPLDNSSGNADGYECQTFSINPELFYKLDLAGHLEENCDVFFNEFGRVEAVHFRK